MNGDSFAEGDRRLKILWIDDRPADNFPKLTEMTFTWSRIYVVDGKTSPEAVAETFPAAREAALSGHKARHYALSPAPYDIILADFRLSEPPGGAPSLAARAPAAGLTLAVLTAFQCPDHPVAIIPYSAHPEEFGSQYELLRLGWPPTLHVVSDPLLHKAGPGGKEALLLRASKEYRKALMKSIEAGICHIAVGEQHRWRAVLATDAPGNIQLAETVSILTPWGARSIGVESLFADCAEQNGIPSTPISEWISDVPVPKPVEQRARELAELYWALADSGQSRWRYRVAEKIAAGEQPEEFDVSFPPDAVFKPLYYFKTVSPGLSESGDEEAINSCAPLRLALLFLLIRALSQRHQGPKGRVDPLLASARFAQADIRDAIEEYCAVRPLEDEEELLKLYEELRKEIEPLAVTTPITELEVLRLIHPLPDKWAFKLTLGKDGAIGKELSRWDPPLDVKSLLSGDGRGLLPSERLSSRRYAMEFLPTSDDLPAWLT